MKYVTDFKKERKKKQLCSLKKNARRWNLLSEHLLELFFFGGEEVWLLLSFYKNFPFNFFPLLVQSKYTENLCNFSCNLVDAGTLRSVYCSCRSIAGPHVWAEMWRASSQHWERPKQHSISATLHWIHFQGSKAGSLFSGHWEAHPTDQIDNNSTHTKQKCCMLQW